MQNQPLCLVFEDLHWVDAETQTFLEMLVESIPAARIFLLVNYRPDFESKWAGKSYCSHLRIDPLPAASADELLDRLLGSGAELVAIKNSLIEATQGNPLFIEESVRSLIEAACSMDLRPVASGWPAAADFVPRTIEALLAARIDRLRPELKELLQCAAVIGHDIKEALLEAVTGLEFPSCGAPFGICRSQSFSRKGAVSGNGIYLQARDDARICLCQLVAERRTALHARAAHALETLAAGRLDEHVERLADHAERGALWDKPWNTCSAQGSRRTRSTRTEMLRAYSSGR